MPGFAETRPGRAGSRRIREPAWGSADFAVPEGDAPGARPVAVEVESGEIRAFEPHGRCEAKAEPGACE